MNLFHTSKGESRIELCERCASACDAACIAEYERERIFQNLLRYGYRSL
ncbi:MAG: hypothetical protein WBQ14_02060 [Gaiellaceae bacterium]